MNRSFTARLARNTPRRLRDYLWATHRIFNESLCYLLKHYFWMQNLTDRAPEEDQKNRLRNRFDAAQLQRLRLIYRDMMGLDLPKEKRAGRSQSAQAWMEPITFSIGSTGKGPGESSKNIQPQAKQAIRELRNANLWLFDRELALPVSPDNGFRRGLFGNAARRILNFEQNEDTHQDYYEGARKAFERWTGGQQREGAEDDATDNRRGGWRRTVLLRAWTKHQAAEREAEMDEIGRLCWDDFDRARMEFETYERARSETRAREHGRQLDERRIERFNAGMTRGWRDIYERLLPPGAERPPDRQTAEQIIKEYQKAEPRRVGDINLFLWLADKPHLWRFVETMRSYNDFSRRLDQYAKPIQFRYPRYNQRPEWFTFSETSPGHMYTIVSMNPLVVEFSVLVPVEDAPILKKVRRGEALTEEEQSRLDSPIELDSYKLSGDRLGIRREAYRADLEQAKPGIIARSKLDDVHAWTDGVWQHLMDAFFRDDLPLDLGRFERIMVRYRMVTDARLAPFVESPENDDEARGRLVVEAEEAQEHHWQGRYKFWFGPLADRNGSLVERRRFLRMLPLEVGGIRLEYRGRLRHDANPIFTLSCELDENVTGADGKAKRPSPEKRISGSKLGKPLKRNGWAEPDDHTIICRFKEQSKLQAHSIEPNNMLADDYPAPGVRLIRRRPRPTKANKDPRPVVAEAWFDRRAGWQRKPAGATEVDAGKYVEDWISEAGARSIDVGTRMLLIDLGLRHLGTGAIVEFADDGHSHGVLSDPFKPKAVEFLDVPGIGLSHIERHQFERKKKQQKACPRGDRKSFEIRGAHLPRGQDFARNLLDHVENLKDDRRKKAAHVILRAALKHKVHYIIFEQLKGYRPEAEFGRRVNASLMNWNRRELVEFVKMEAAPFGIHVYDFVPPHHTSRFCHRCGAVGHRFTHITAVHAAKDAPAPEVMAVDEQGKPVLDAKGQPVSRRIWTPAARRVRGTPLGLIAGMRQAIDGGKQFCCAECGLIVNADLNAAMNLARKLAGDFPAYQKYRYDSEQKSWVVDGATLVGKAFWNRAKSLVQQHLNRRFRQATETPPAGGWPEEFPMPATNTPF